MLVSILTITLFFFNATCEKITPIEEPSENGTIPICLADIIRKYYAANKKIVYVNMDPGIDLVLRMLHSLEIISINTRVPPTSVLNLNLGYMISVKTVPELVQNIYSLNQEFSWNLYARFLVAIRSLEKFELRQVFDIFLVLHVNNVVVVNGSHTAELYTYNPYDEFACGKYYTKIIEFGKCLDVTANIYPQKVTTGLRNCFFNVSVPHWPPYGMNPSKVKDGTNPIGTEQYIFNLISKIEHFKYKFNFDYNPESFSLVSQNMSVTGPMLKLKNNLTDVMLGGLMLIPSRAQMFFYIYGHLDYVDEIRLMVKRAGVTPAWKDVYLEFSPLVWVLLLLSFVIYTVVVVIMLRAEDKGYVTMILLDNLLSHGSKFRCRQSVKYIFILWVWFAYLVNSFYTTTLMSLTTKPGVGHQIRDEQTVLDRDLKPCISLMMNKFRISQFNNAEILQDIDIGIKGCEKHIDSIKSVSESYDRFTILLYSVYTFYKYQFYDEYGRSPVYSFSKPYAKVIYAMYFNKGFPMYERLHMLALRIRETGLSDKSLNDHYYNQKIKYHFRPKHFVSRFAIPWYPYIIGIFISSITFVAELASQYKKV